MYPFPDYNGFRGASDLNPDMTVKTTEGRREAAENHRENNNSVVLCASSAVLCGY